jgi:cobalamin-dependent methionine synthase I
MAKFIIDSIKEIALGAASHYLTEYIKNKYKVENMAVMNPGSLEDWPISEQKPFFSLFDNVEELIGVKLTDSFLMLPIKSISGIYFPTETSFASCQLCPREKCPNRRAKYDPELKEKYLSE